MWGIEGGSRGEEDVAVDGEPPIWLTNQRKENGKEDEEESEGRSG